MVNARWEGQSQETLQWRLQEILTRKSFVILFSWERKIKSEPSHGWFPPRFPQDNWSLTASSGKANDWRNREHVVLDLFSNWHCVESKGFFGEPLWGQVMNIHEGKLLVNWTDDDLPSSPCVDSKKRFSVCTLKTSLCVYRHHAHMLKSMCACCRHTRGRFESTHGGVLSLHTGFSACHTTHHTHNNNTPHNSHTNTHKDTRTHHQHTETETEKEDRERGKTRRKTRQDKTRQDKTRQDKTRQDKTRQDKTRQDKTRQDKTRQDKTRQDKTRWKVSDRCWLTSSHHSCPWGQVPDNCWNSFSQCVPLSLQRERKREKERERKKKRERKREKKSEEEKREERRTWIRRWKRRQRERKKRRRKTKWKNKKIMIWTDAETGVHRRKLN